MYSDSERNAGTPAKTGALRAQSGILSPAYWREAAKQLTVPRMLVFAALITALRVAVKMFKIPIATGVSLSFDCYVNSLGSMVYGPVVALLVGAVSDTVGYLLFPSGAYFLPFILVEMTSSFLFALFLWRREITAPRVLAAKFSVNLVCNIFMTSLFMKWSYYVFSGAEAAQAYSIFNLVRVAKSLVLFPLEAVLIVTVLSAFLPALRRLRIVPADQRNIKPEPKHIVFFSLLTLFSVALIVFYVVYLRGFLASHNVKLF